MNRKSHKNKEKLKESDLKLLHKLLDSISFPSTWR
jgi:hypothetical protein